MRLFNSTTSQPQALSYSKLALACLLALGTVGMVGCDKSTLIRPQQPAWKPLKPQKTAKRQPPKMASYQ